VAAALAYTGPDLGPGSGSCACLPMVCSVAGGRALYVRLAVSSSPPRLSVGAMGAAGAVFNKGECSRVSLVRRWRLS
jgi:hypothetical protein